MKIFFYTLRPWDERPCAERLAAETGIAFDGCEAYPTLENAALAAGSLKTPPWPPGATPSR